MAPAQLVQDVVCASNIIRFSPSVVSELRRSVTVKLPMPTASSDQPLSLDDIAIYQSVLNTSVWTMVDVPLKLTKNSVAFDTRWLGQYAIYY